MSDGNMGVGVWVPGERVESKEVDNVLLARLTVLANAVGDEVTPAALREHRLEFAHWLMALEADAWTPAGDLDSEDIVRLIRFFTLLETQVSGWNAGKTSPVIALVKLLRERGEFDSELRQWIKANTDNRYLPYGSVL